MSKLQKDDIEHLARAIKKEVALGRKRALEAIQNEKIRMYWRIGKLIKTQLLANEDRADYGDYLFKELEKSTSISETDLYKSVRLYDSYPQIPHSSAELSWTHFKLISSQKSKELQQMLIQTVSNDKLSVRELHALIKDRKARSKTPVKLKVKRGELFTYRIKTVDSQTRVELGFGISIDSPLPHLTKDTVIKSDKDGDTYRFSNTDTGVDPYYTYVATVIQIVDGDTFWADIDLGFGCHLKQKLRLRGVDTPPLGTPIGDKAKRYLDKRLKINHPVVIKTYWTDKFHRYLTDVFYHSDALTADVLVTKGRFLNQELLNKKLAVYEAD